MKRSSAVLRTCTSLSHTMSHRLRSSSGWQNPMELSFRDLLALGRLTRLQTSSAIVSLRGSACRLRRRASPPCRSSGNRFRRKFRGLTISLLTSEREGLRQLEQAVGTPAGTVANSNPRSLERQILENEQAAAQLRKSIDKVDSSISAIAGKQLENVPASLQLGSEFLTPAELAERVVRDRSAHECCPIIWGRGRNAIPNSRPTISWQPVKPGKSSAICTSTWTRRSRVETTSSTPVRSRPFTIASSRRVISKGRFTRKASS